MIGRFACRPGEHSLFRVPPRSVRRARGGGGNARLNWPMSRGGLRRNPPRALDHREVADNLTGTRHADSHALGAPEVGPPSSGWAVVRGRNPAVVHGVMDSSRSMGRNYREVADNLTGTRKEPPRDERVCLGCPRGRSAELGVGGSGAGGRCAMDRGFGLQPAPCSEPPRGWGQPHGHPEGGLVCLGCP